MDAPKVRPAVYQNYTIIYSATYASLLIIPVIYQRLTTWLDHVVSITFNKILIHVNTGKVDYKYFCYESFSKVCTYKLRTVRSPSRISVGSCTWLHTIPSHARQQPLLNQDTSCYVWDADKTCPHSYWVEMVFLFLTTVTLTLTINTWVAISSCLLTSAIHTLSVVSTGQS